MENIIRYTVLFSIISAVLYLFYYWVIKKTDSFQTIRFFLLLVVLVSIVLPLHQHQLKILPASITSEVESKIETTEADTNLTHTQSPPEKIESPLSEKSGWNTSKIILILYISLTIAFFLNLARTVISIFRIKLKSCIQISNRSIFYTNKINSPFTFFSWIFIPTALQHDKNIKEIVKHEFIHANQLHTVDVLAIELVKAVFWFNPFIWLLAREIKQNHEYIADKKVVDSGIDKTGYQALLINQIAEEKLLTLPSGFNHSLIKKRIVMLTKNKFKQKTGLRVLTSVPLLTILFLGISCVNGQMKAKESKPLAVVAPTKMNVFYIGVDNPVSIAVSEYKTDEIEVGVTNGRIKGENGKYQVNPRKPGNSFVFVIAEGDTVGKYEFRVKRVPDPIAVIGNKTSGFVSVDYLLKQDGINVALMNFDFDLSFEVVSFVMSATEPGEFVVYEELSDGAKFSEAQLKLIKGLVKYQKLTIENIKAKGPDGAIRQLSPMVFTITDQ